jgi:hypothetical protein
VLDILVSPGDGVRCRAIRVIFRTTARLHLGPQRGWEEDVIFERKTELIGGSDEGIGLSQGYQKWVFVPSTLTLGADTDRFEFTIILPSTLASHDWHKNGRVSHMLYAEVEGEPHTGNLISNMMGSFSSGRRSSSSSDRDKPRSLRSRSPSPLSTSSTSPRLSPENALSITRQEAFLPQAPTYSESQEEAGSSTGIPWVRGTHKASEPISVLHNPSKMNTHNDLDMRQSDYAPGLGIYELKVFSDIVSKKSEFTSPSADACSSLLEVQSIWELRSEKYQRVLQSFTGNSS